MAESSRAQSLDDISAEGAHFLIVEARFYDSVSAKLLQGATAALKKAEATFDVVTVPGALEIPAAVVIALEESEDEEPYDGVIALGCVIRGDTYHFEIVASESARALMGISVSMAMPLGNGILTVENEAQALERADPARGDKGGDAARAALTLYRLAFSKAV